MFTLTSSSSSPSIFSFVKRNNSMIQNSRKVESYVSTYNLTFLTTNLSTTLPLTLETLLRLLISLFSWAYLLCVLTIITRVSLLKHQQHYVILLHTTLQWFPLTLSIEFKVLTAACKGSHHLLIFHYILSLFFCFKHASSHLALPPTCRHIERLTLEVFAVLRTPPPLSMGLSAFLLCLFSPITPYPQGLP